MPEKRTTFVCFLSQLSMITKMSPENDIQTPYGLHSPNLITSCICVFLRCSQFCHRNQYKLDYHYLSLLCRLACFLKLFGLTWLIPPGGCRDIWYCPHPSSIFLHRYDRKHCIILYTWFLYQLLFVVNQSTVCLMAMLQHLQHPFCNHVH